MADLVALAYMANLKNVSFEPDTGSVYAQDSLLKISTHLIPGLGQVVMVDGDFAEIRLRSGVIGIGSWAQIYGLVYGHFPGVRLSTSIHYLDEQAVLFAFFVDWEPFHWGEYRKKAFSRNLTIQQYVRKASPVYQCEEYVKVSRDESKSWTDVWSEIIGGHSPTIIKYLAFVPFTREWRATPCRLFISPYSNYLDTCRTAWGRSQGQAHIPKLRQHPKIEQGIVDGIPSIMARVEPQWRFPGYSVNMVSIQTWIMSWAWLPMASFIAFWDLEIAKQLWDFSDGDGFDLLLPRYIIDIMLGSTVTSTLEYLKKYSGYYAVLPELDPYVLFSLFAVETRLQAIWVRFERDDETEASSFSKFFGNMRIENLTREDLRDYWVLAHAGKWVLQPLMASFMALWFELGERVDVIGDTQVVQGMMTLILREWQSDDTPCITAPIPHVETEAEKVVMKKVKTRKEFAEYALGGDSSAPETRLVWLEKLIPMLQLRIFLMEISYRIQADSSDIAALPGMGLPAVNVTLV
ncbi:hypothetical protein ABW19_dt0204444 [Dactylella cylindrospora]|nr:hypothetical protein ABW19_dt0204444 [Dactylella cylindrospora]